MSWKQKQREKGWKDVLVWLCPEAIEALQGMENETGKRRRELINNAILAYAGKESSQDASQKLEERLKEIEARLARLENPQDPAFEAIKAKKEEGKSYKEIISLQKGI